MADSRGISFVGDVARIAEGTGVDDVTSKLKRCAAANLRWARSNAVRFEVSKMARSDRSMTGASEISEWECTGPVLAPRPHAGWASDLTPRSTSHRTAGSESEKSARLS